MPAEASASSIGKNRKDLNLERPNSGPVACFGGCQEKANICVYHKIAMLVRKIRIPIGFRGISFSDRPIYFDISEVIRRECCITLQ